MSPGHSADHPESVAAALDALDRFMAALNRRDEPALNAALHFPHVRLTAPAPPPRRHGARIALRSIQRIAAARPAA